ncbi:major facilitator superfamily domain-containing protein [Dactylonectria estremocensis]|uniref:Major facilitator superfamily domain-containing protein n=1 Tax=Dactylonectria estremocensis TaxID=1079267 RepID=A0A9P9EUI0_9HYPO|nr:major facilitator superfamily domain-containing protein [Dactylonectria estremocensis]
MVNHQDADRQGEITPAGYNHAPGTELLFKSGKPGALTHDLQFVQDRNGNHIILVPQPSITDPNDPLRWSKLKKWATFLNGVAYAFMGSVTGPIMAAGMIPLTQKFGVSLQKLTYANGATLICQGVGNIFWMPLAIKLGRRPVYMLSNLLMGIACIWLGLASDASYTPFIVGRACLGLFEAPIESIVPTTITDMFFLHDRGEKVSAYGLAVLGGNELGPLFSALIIQHLDMAWAFYIVTMFIGLNAITMFFFMPETKYRGQRPGNALNEDTIQQNGEKSFAQIIEDTRIAHSAGVEAASVATPKHSCLSKLRPWQKVDPHVSLRKVFLRPFVLVSYPTVLWTCLIYGISLSWNVIIGSTVAQLFAEPYGFDSQAQGLVFLSPFVGSLVGSWLCGSVSDSIASYFTLKNSGIREPEMRLPTLLIATFLTFFGTLMAGLTYDYHTHWAGPVVGFGVLTAGAQMGVSLSMSYALDCHKELSVELMVTVASIKSLIAWIWTWVINDWIIADGMLTVFMVIASINVAIHLTTIALFWKGKAIRVWIHEKGMLGRCGLD